METLSRRTFIGSSLAAGAAATLPVEGFAAAGQTSRRRLPAIGSGGKQTSLAQFARLGSAIGQGDAVLFLDLAAFDNNFRIITKFARSQSWQVRPALKSFQSPGFTAYTLRKLPQPRGMIFHLRHVDPVLSVAPTGTDLMTGYPPAPQELERYLATSAPRGTRRHRVRIMIDSLALLERAARLAKRARRSAVTEIALQLESGFYLSGFDAGEELAAALKMLRANRRTLRLTAVMNYDGHGAATGDPEYRRRVQRDSDRRFRTLLAQLAEDGKGLYDPKTLVRNGPASSTYRLWAGSPAPNEISPGAGFLFHGYITGEGHDNEGLEYTLLHGAPVHRSPGRARGLISGGPYGGPKVSIATKGGAWPEHTGKQDEIVYPEGLDVDEGHGGRGNNQAHYLAPKRLLQLGDYVLGRPLHAGDAIDYFGAMAAVRSGELKRIWPTVPRPFTREYGA